MAPAPLLKLAPGTPPPRVLVVDDLASNRLSMSRVLISRGFAVREAEDGHEAVEIAEQWAPHAVLMDLQMPGLDGFAATKRIRQAAWGAKIVVIVISGDLAESSRADALAAGAIAFFPKPFVEADILAALARELGLFYV